MSTCTNPPKTFDPYLLVAVAQLCHVAKVHVGDATITQAEDVSRVGVAVEQTKLKQLTQT
jgi:hypothetical protein